MWKNFGEVLTTTDVTTGKRVYDGAKPNENRVLHGIRSWFILVNNPTLTSVSFEIYSNDTGNVPGKLLHTSLNSVTKARLLPTLNSSCYSSFWEFDDVPMKGTDIYHFIPRFAGYSPTASSYIAWRKDWPDPVYRTGVSIGYTKVLTNPFCLALIGADL